MSEMENKQVVEIASMPPDFQAGAETLQRVARDSGIAYLTDDQAHILAAAVLLGMKKKG